MLAYFFPTCLDKQSHEQYNYDWIIIKAKVNWEKGDNSQITPDNKDRKVELEWTKTCYTSF